MDIVLVGSVPLNSTVQTLLKSSTPAALNDIFLYCSEHGERFTYHSISHTAKKKSWLVSEQTTLTDSAAVCFFIFHRFIRLWLLLLCWIEKD